MKLEVTERDKKLLVFLAVFLIVVGIGFGIILPLLNKNQQVKAEIADAELEQIEREQKAASVSGMEKKLEEAKTQLSEAQAVYSGKVESRDIDKMLTDVAVSNGVTVKTLNIEMPVPGEYTTLMDYSKMLESKEKRADTSVAEEDLPVYQGMYTVRVNLTMSGSRGQLQNVLDWYGSSEPKIRVREFLWRAEDRKVSDLYALSVALDVYMIGDASELQAPEETETEAETEGLE